MDVLVPFAVDEPKSRLAPVLTPAERREFARAMLVDVLDAIETAGGSPHLLATAPFDPTTDLPEPRDLPVTVDDRPLTDAVNAALERRIQPADDADTVDDSLIADDAHKDSERAREAGVAVVMADLALATPDALTRLFTPAHHTQSGESAAGVTIAPGRGGGTNALVVRRPSFRVDYHGASYLDHCRAAARLDTTVRTVDSYRLAVDIDEPADMAEVLIHGSGVATMWLRDAGFVLDTTDGRVSAIRT